MKRSWKLAWGGTTALLLLMALFVGQVVDPSPPTTEASMRFTQNLPLIVQNWAREAAEILGWLPMKSSPSYIWMAYLDAQGALHIVRLDYGQEWKLQGESTKEWVLGREDRKYVPLAFEWTIREGREVIVFLAETDGQLYMADPLDQTVIPFFPTPTPPPPDTPQPTPEPTPRWTPRPTPTPGPTPQ